MDDKFEMYSKLCYNNKNMQSERIAADVFAQGVRPAAEHIRDLVIAGVTEEDIVTAGSQGGLSPDGIAAARTEIHTLLPYIHQLSDAIYAAPGKGQALFAGRDAEVLYDDYRIVYDEGTLIPASKNLWRCRAMDTHGSRFLGAFGLTATAVHEPEHRFTLIDTGFRGSVASDIDYWLEKYHGRSVLKEQRLAVRLVCAADAEALGPSLIQYGFDQIPRTNAELPNTLDRLGVSEFDLLLEHGRQLPEGIIATALQLLPRYHAAHAALVELEDKVVAVPGRSDFYQYGKNASVVDPLAAAVVQYHTVVAALERKAVIGLA